MRQIDRDVDPQFVAARQKARESYLLETAAWGVPARCRANICDGDGSCVSCGADQGESCRSARQTTDREDGK